MSWYEDFWGVCSVGTEQFVAYICVIFLAIQTVIGRREGDQGGECRTGVSVTSN